MIQSILKPTVVRLKRMRRQYKNQGMNLAEFYSVIVYDMKQLIVTSKKADVVYFIKWEDVELVQSVYLPERQGASLDSGDVQALRRVMRRLSNALPAMANK